LTKKLPFETSRLALLIVDDHPQIRKAVMRIVEKMEFGELIEAANGSEALKILSERPIDLVVLDLFLLDVSGFDVLEHIRNREVDSDIPVLVVTGEGSKDEIVKAADLGASDYLLKPFQAEELKTKCLKLLTKYYSPSPLLSLVRKAERLFLEKRFANALVTIEEALQRDPKSVRARHLKAITLDKLGQTDTAVKLLNENAELNESYYRTYAALAEIHLREKRNEEAIAAMLREVELNPKQPRRQTQIGTMMLSAGRVEKAIEHFREALKENVKYRLALFGMGRAYAAVGNLEKAVYYYKRLRRYYPTNTKALEAIVKCCLDANDPVRAEHALRDEKNTNKTRTDTYIVLSKLYLATERKQDALNILDELLLVDLGNKDGLKLKAALHCKYGEFQPAIDIYHELIKTHEDYEMLINYSDVLMQAKQFTDAATVLHRCFRFQFNYAEVFKRLGFCYQNSEQYAKASVVYTTLLNKLGIEEDVRTNLQHCQKALTTRRVLQTKRIAS